MSGLIISPENLAGFRSDQPRWKISDHTLYRRHSDLVLRPRRDDEGQTNTDVASRKVALIKDEVVEVRMVKSVFPQIAGAGGWWMKDEGVNPTMLGLPLQLHTKVPALVPDGDKRFPCIQ
jgi:hypothetical protein